MLKNSELKLAVLLLVVAGFVMAVQPKAEAWGGLPIGATSGQKIIDYCAKQLKISSKSKDSRLAACAYGYVLAIQGKKSSGCDTQFKKDKNADKACKDPGFSSGQKDPLGIKPKGGGGGGGSPSTPSSPTPTGAGTNCDETHCDLVQLYVNPAIRLLSILVGLVIGASLVMGGVQYAAAGSDPQKVSAAKSRISNTLMAFFAYAFMYAFLNFLIPGGVFK